MPIHVGGESGQGSGLSEYFLGETSGAETVTLLESQIPSHTHTVSPLASDDERATDEPGGAYPSTGGIYAATQNSNAPLGASTSSSVGGNPHNNLQPYLVLNYVIALQGIFPARS